MRKKENRNSRRRRMRRREMRWMRRREMRWMRRRSTDRKRNKRRGKGALHRSSPLRGTKELQRSDCTCFWDPIKVVQY